MYVSEIKFWWQNQFLITDFFFYRVGIKWNVKCKMYIFCTFFGLIAGLHVLFSQQMAFLNSLYTPVSVFSISKLVEYELLFQTFFLISKVIF